VGRDIVVVAAAGNQGSRAKPLFPAAYPGVIAVTAVDQHKRVYRRAGQGAHIDLAAPGVRIWTAASVKGARPRTGTSFATPFVTAAAAVLRGKAPQLDHAGIHAVLARTALDLGPPGKDEIFGSGLLQAGGLCAAGVAQSPNQWTDQILEVD
jgi:subtilisin family serine protease